MLIALAYNVREPELLAELSTYSAVDHNPRHGSRQAVELPMYKLYLKHIPVFVGDRPDSESHHVGTERGWSVNLISQ